MQGEVHDVAVGRASERRDHELGVIGLMPVDGLEY
jgi:hypothetical protein